MDVVQRNFFRLLKSGTFGDSEPVEPMSAWKWNRLRQMSLMHGVAALVADGIERHSGDFFMRLLPEQMTNWHKTTEETEAANNAINRCVSDLFGIMNKEQLRPILLKGQAMAALYDNPLHRTGGDIDVFLPYSTQGEKADSWARDNSKNIITDDKFTLSYNWQGIAIEHHHRMQNLTNPWLNRRLQGIINREISCCDSSYIRINDTKIEILPPTLNLLFIIIRIVRFILNDGLCLKQIVDLGLFLRKVGDKVDFVTLQTWLNRLHMQWMARLTGSILVRLFGFTVDEIPFMNGRTDSSIEKRTNELLHLTHKDNWYFTQGENIFVHTKNSNTLMWQIKNSTRYMKYYPTETVTNLFSNFAHSLSHIEE